MKSVVVGVLVAAALATVVPAVGLAGEPPLADAGLDQQTSVGATVQLDATGSRDPDGSITAYNWTIEAPNGTIRSPACQSCGETSFRPYRIGQYNVTVTVTDDDGVGRSDTLYLTVEPGDGPTVSLSGTESPVVGSSTTYTADTSAGNVPLERIEWQKNGSEVGSEALGGDQQTSEQGLTFSNQTPKNVSVTVIDVAGQRANESLIVSPRAASRGGGGGCCRGYYDPQADGGNGAWIQTGEDGRPLAPNSIADAYNYGQDNGVASNVYTDPGDSHTGDADPRATEQSGSDVFNNGDRGSGSGNEGAYSDRDDSGDSGSSGTGSAGGLLNGLI